LIADPARGPTDEGPVTDGTVDALVQELEAIDPVELRILLDAMAEPTAGGQDGGDR